MFWYIFTYRCGRCNGDRVAVSFATALGTTACTGDGAISVAAASKMIAHHRNYGKDRDDGDDGKGEAISVAAASGTTEAVLMSQWAVIFSHAKSSLKHILRKKNGL
jgi:hypothetical protein